jgi:hypothetical protein
MEVIRGRLVVINAVSEGVAMRFSKREVISGATERSSPRVINADDLGEDSEMCRDSGCESGGSEGEHEVSEAKCGAFGESGGCRIASGMSGERLDTTGGRKGCAGSPGGDRGDCA